MSISATAINSGSDNATAYGVDIGAIEAAFSNAGTISAVTF
ncbi:hypothetical protein [Yoonia sp. BS5-3]|uniref:Flagellin n=1 Tax=Yoonia phaeophyticola TaxID=3137369 RepID=A0ABZ2V3Q4_9RHOB